MIACEVLSRHDACSDEIIIVSSSIDIGCEDSIQAPPMKCNLLVASMVQSIIFIHCKAESHQHRSQNLRKAYKYACPHTLCGHWEGPPNNTRNHHSSEIITGGEYSDCIAVLSALCQVSDEYISEWL